MRCCRQANRLNARLLPVFILAAIALFCGCAPSSEALIQCFYVAQSAQHALPACEVYTLSVKAKEGRRSPTVDDSLGSRLDVYVQTQYSRLHFEKTNELFKGSYTVSFIVRDLNESVVRSKDVERSPVARSYGETVSSRSDAFLQTFFLSPGTYLLDIVIVDNGSGLRQRHRRNVEAKNFSNGNFCASDYLLFENAQSDQRGISLTPMFPSELSFARDSIGMFQEVYNLQRGDTVRLHLAYTCPRSEGFSDTRPPSQSTPYLPRPPQCIRPADSTYYSSDSVFIAGTNGSVQIFQYFPKPAMGVGSITRAVYRSRNGISDSSVNAMKTVIYPSTFPRYSGVDEEIAALATIARSDEVDSMQIGSSQFERRIRIREFWEKHGGAIRQKEFDDRIREANVLFSSCVEGWKTPMGITYIICGPPDYVECQGFGDEIWYYDLGGNRALSIPFRLNLENEFGKYYEIVPFSVNNYLWQHFIDRWRRQ
jgi:GWxTD domain-containing protein